MISRDLTRRWERLETRFTPTRDPLVLRMHFVSRENVVTSTMALELDHAGAQSKKKQVGDEGYHEATSQA
jgi:hypothetical protein